jgi:hypothetical protein
MGWKRRQKLQEPLTSDLDQVSDKLSAAAALTLDKKPPVSTGMDTRVLDSAWDKTPILLSFNTVTIQQAQPFSVMPSKQGNFEAAQYNIFTN